MASDYKAARDALAASHEHLAGIVESLSAEAASAPSYCDDWTIAQALSHIGSGGVIADMIFKAALDGAEAPSRELYQQVWDVWDARTPAEILENVLPASAQLVSSLNQANDAALESLQIELMGRTFDAAGLIRRRLNEHALHTWDVEVMREPGAEVQQIAVEQLIDNLVGNSARLARGDRPSFTGQLTVQTSEPDRSFTLDLSGETVEIATGAEGTGEITMSAACLLRLTYGRLDEAHTPASVQVSGPVSLDELRTLFRAS